MSALGLFFMLAGGLPLLYGLALLVRRRQRERRAAQAQHAHSIFAIAARVAQERELAEQQPARWPRADPDHGCIHDNRPTLVLPQVGRHARPEDDTVPLVVRPTPGPTFLPFHTP
ncbi:MAG TPA: hypothetical protein VJR27_00805 [Candidatus Saccharimonadales bacterium]|nr:hypothetical protein [Candidatus Saccharimonadales bacterium]